MPFPTFSLVTSLREMSSIIEQCALLAGKGTHMYCDLEGNSLGKTGTVSLFQLLITSPNDSSASSLYILDITVLGTSAFNTPSESSGTTFGNILSNPDITKVFFDCRKDSEALFHLHGVALQGIHDLQLMKLARTYSGGPCSLPGLAACIAYDIERSDADKFRAQATKQFGKTYCSQGWHVFDERPLHPGLLAYAAQDAAEMPALYAKYNSELTEPWWARVQAETLHRITLSQSDDTYAGRLPWDGPESWAKLRWPAWGPVEMWGDEEIEPRPYCMEPLTEEEFAAETAARRAEQKEVDRKYREKWQPTWDAEKREKEEKERAWEEEEEARRQAEREAVWEEQEWAEKEARRQAQPRFVRYLRRVKEKAFYRGGEDGTPEHPRQRWWWFVPVHTSRFRVEFGVTRYWRVKEPEPEPKKCSEDDQEDCARWSLV